MTYRIHPGDEKMRAKFEKAARLLSGRDKLTLLFAPPLASGADGHVFTDEWGISRIYIMPGISLQRGFETMLHEAAHLRLGHCARPYSASRLQATAFDDARKVNARPGVVDLEKQVDRLADNWLAQAWRLCKSSIKWYHGEEEICIAHLAVLPYIKITE